MRGTSDEDHCEDVSDIEGAKVYMRDLLRFIMKAGSTAYL